MKIAMVVASKDFRDEEYFIPREKFDNKGIKVSVFSDKKGLITGVSGGEGEADYVLKDFIAEDFDAVSFIGGPGAVKFLDNEEGYEIARTVKKQDILLSAICISPLILAKAGVLQGVRATVWSSSMEKGAIKILKEEGGIYRKESVVQDGKIITAEGPQSAEEFAEKIIESLTKK